MKRVSSAAAAALFAVSGCTGQSDEPQASPSESSAAAVEYEQVDLSEICDALVAEPLQDLADTYGFVVELDDEEEERTSCYGYLEFIKEDGSSEAGINGMSVFLSADRYDDAGEAESAFAAQSDPDSADFRMTMTGGPFTPETVDHSGWDDFAIVVADTDAALQELRALVRKGTVIVNIRVTVDSAGWGAESCRPYSGQTSCAMTLEVADDWVRSSYADDLLEVVSGLDQ